jgi:hypothetical protein
VTIDEYDSSLMSALSNTLLVDNLSVKQESGKIESQFRRFFSCLKEANKSEVYTFVTGVSPLCLTEFTSGWNHATRISDMEEFADLYGFTQEDILQGIKMIQPSIPKQIQQMLLKHCDCYDGYLFHPRQKQRLFNCGRVTYFLQQVWSKNRLNTTSFDYPEQQYKYLVKFQDDSQTRPAETTLSYITKSKVSRSLLQELLSDEDAIVECEGVDPYFNLAQLQNDKRDLISFM